MVDEDDAMIDRFNLIAELLKDSKDARVELVWLIKCIAGEDTSCRITMFASLLPFLKDFGKNGWGPQDKSNYKIGYIYSGIQNGRVKWPIAPLLAWLSVEDRKKLDEFLIKYGLLEKARIENCHYTSPPGSLADRRKADVLADDIELSCSRKAPVRQSARRKEKREAEVVASSSTNNDDTSLDALAKVIVRNRRHIRQLLNIVADMASVSNIPGHDVEKTLRRILTRRGSSRKEQAYNHTYLPGRRPKPVSRHAAQPFDAVKDISGALLWLRSVDPAKLASYYETIGAMRMPSGRIKLSRLL